MGKFWQGRQKNRMASCLLKNQITDLVCFLIRFHKGLVLVSGSLSLGLTRDVVRGCGCPPAQGPGVGNRRSGSGSWAQVLVFPGTERKLHVFGQGVPDGSVFVTRELGLAGLRGQFSGIAVLLAMGVRFAESEVPPSREWVWRGNPLP